MTAPCLTPLFGRPALAQGILTVGSHGREVLRAVAGEREIYTEMLSHVSLLGLTSRFRCVACGAGLATEASSCARANRA